MRNVTIVLAVVAVLALSGSAWASTYTWVGGGGDNKWVNSGNWSLTSGLGNPDGLPHYHLDVAIVGTGFTPTVSAGEAAQAGPMSLSGTINQTGGTHKSFNGTINAGGIYNISGGTHMGAGSFVTKGALNVSAAGGVPSGGSKVGVQGSGVMTLSGGSIDAGYLYLFNVGSTFHATGGTLDAGGASAGWSSYMKKGSLFHVDGPGSTITLRGGFMMYEAATMQYTVTAAGVTTANVVQADYTGSPPAGSIGDVTFTTVGDDDSIIKVLDSSAAVGDYTLLTWTGTETGTPVLDLPSSDWSWKNQATWAGDNEIVVNKIPEPATLALLGLGGLGVLLRRRKRA